MPRELFLCSLLVASCISSFAQQKTKDETFYFWTPDWRTTDKVDSAAYLSTMRRLNDSCWQMDTWTFTGPMFTSEQYRDEHAHTLHGKQIYYRASGYIDSTGRMNNGLPDGYWNYVNDSGRIVAKKLYDNGRLVSVEPTAPADSAGAKLKEGESESTFPGGLPGWRRYLLRKMQYPDRALKLGMKGEVQVQFSVTAEGRIEDAAICKSVEYSLDELTLSIINDSPKWKPAQQDGHAVKSYKKQPLVFKF